MDTYDVELRWQGHTAERGFPKEGVADAEGKPPIAVSTAESYGGSHAHWNPEELFGAALALCHMQTFLALAQKVGVDVRAYHDRTWVEVAAGDDKVTRIRRVVLRPTIAITAASDPEKALKFFHKAHHYCFVANSTTAEVVLEPTFVTA